MILTIKGRIILITDDAGSSYITGALANHGDDYSHIQWIWYAIDENGRNCVKKNQYLNTIDYRHLMSAV